MKDGYVLMKTSNPWSYSSIKLFEQCPKKYYHLRVAKDVKEKEGEAIVYGHRVHKAAEQYIKTNTPLPPEFDKFEPTLKAISNLPGEKHCELKLGVSFNDWEFSATGFFSPNVWLRTVVDLLVIDNTLAYVVDYKTGKNAKYADTTQLDLMAGAVFTHYPEVETIKSGLLYLVSGEFIKTKHNAVNRKSYLSVYSESLERLAVAESSGVWNPVSGPLCRYCPVDSCPHNQRT